MTGSRAVRAIVGIALILVTGGSQVILADSGTHPRDGSSSHGWTSSQIGMLRSLWIGSLPPLPADPTNAVADDPQAAAFGRQLFFDARLSANGEVACGTCHQPERMFTDALPLARGVGTTNRGTMTIVGAAYSPWLFWDGRKDSLWAQALGPMESPLEHGGTRTQYVQLIGRDPTYRDQYEALFGSLPDFSEGDRFVATAGPFGAPVARAAWEAMSSGDRAAVTRVFVNLGKAIAAYERSILPGPSRFDAYVEALLEDDEDAAHAALSSDEIAGLRLFIAEAKCTRCHNGPLLTNNEFHNTGIPAADGLPPDHGRMIGVEQARADVFSCLGPYSDGAESDCAELRFAKSGPALDGAFKTPTLRNVAQTGPYMHAGQFATLAEVLDHYNRAPPAALGHNETVPLHLSRTELAQLEAFLGALSGPTAATSESPPPTQ